MAGAVGGVAGPADGRLAVVAGVAAEAALVDLALGRAVERQAHVLEVDDRVDGLLRQDLGRVLVDQVVAALDGVEGVPLPVVLLDVGERGGHAALRRAGVGAGGVELRDYRGAARFGPASIAARMPAPPAPTMTTSYCGSGRRRSRRSSGPRQSSTFSRSRSEREARRWSWRRSSRMRELSSARRAEAGRSARRGRRRGTGRR